MDVDILTNALGSKNVWSWLDWLNNTANIATLISLLLTFILLYHAWKLRNRYLFLVRGPIIMKQFETHSSQISEHLQSFDTNREEIIVELKKCIALLNSLSSKVDRKTKQSNMKIKNRILGILKNNSITKEVVWDLYGELARLQIEVNNTLDDYKWRL